MTLRREKTVVFAALGAIMAALYFGTLHVPLFAAAVLAPTAVDAAIPFVPLFVVPYLSFFLLVLLPLVVISERRELWDAAFGFGLIVVMSSLTFLFWPTAMPFSDVHPLTRVVVAVDLDGNAFPSLHASLALYCALCARRKLRTTTARYSLFLWTSLVVVSALFIKRHLAVDVAAGALLGWATYAVLFRPAGPRHPTASRSSKRSESGSGWRANASDAFAAVRSYDGRKRAIELAVFLSLAAAGFWVSIYARSVESVPTLVAGILVTAVALNTFPLLVHEGMHGLLFASRRWNWIASVLLGSTFLMSFSAYRVAASPPSSIPRRPARSRRLPQLLAKPARRVVSALRAPRLRAPALHLPHSRAGAEARVAGAAETHLHRVHPSLLHLQRAPQDVFVS